MIQHHHRQHPNRWAQLSLLACLALAASTASAASLQVSPTSLTLTPGRYSDALWISNTGASQVDVQLRVFKWTQPEQSDVLTPTQELVASPPMRTIAPGSRQLIRVVRPAGAPPESEASYRIIVDELPSKDPSQGLQFVLRYSIPVFVQPQHKQAQPQLQVRLDSTDGASVLEVQNTGQGHAQLADLAYAAPGGDIVALQGLVGYVLPGQTMRWTLPGAPDRYASTRFSARINGESNRQPLPFASAPR